MFDCYWDDCRCVCIRSWTTTKPTGNLCIHPPTFFWLSSYASFFFHPTQSLRMKVEAGSSTSPIWWWHSRKDSKMERERERNRIYIYVKNKQNSPPPLSHSFRKEQGSRLVCAAAVTRNQSRTPAVGGVASEPIGSLPFFLFSKVRS